jgi:hypothetical protein
VGKSAACTIHGTIHGTLTRESKGSTCRKGCNERHKQMISYTELAQKLSRENIDFVIVDDDKRFSLLNAQARAEIALVVLVKHHMNRSVGAILGEEMSTAIFGVPRGMPKRMEKPGVMSFVNKIMKPFFSGGMHKTCEPGITLDLFKNDTESSPVLPIHLQGLEVVEAERVIAVARLNAVVSALYESSLSGFVSKQRCFS